MERQLAKELMRTLAAMNETLNAAAALTERIKSREEQQAVRRVIGEVMQTIYLDLMRPIIRQYPELDPDAASSKPSKKD